MVQVTPKPRELDIKMSEEKNVKDTAGGTGQKMPELQTVRFEWPGLQVGAGPEILVYKPSLRSRPGEVPQGMQQVPAIWLTPPRGAPWQYSGLADNNLANGPPAQSSLHGYKHIFACAGLVVLLLLIMRYVEQFLPQLKMRSRRFRARSGPSGLHITCQLNPSEGMPPSVTFSTEAGEECFHASDKPPAYIENPEEGASTSANNEKPSNGRAPPASRAFKNGKVKVTRLDIFELLRDRRLLEKLRNKPGVLSGPRHVSINMPKTTGKPNQKGHLVIDIKGAENESGCVVGFRRSTENSQSLLIQPPVTDATPANLTVESLNLDEDIK